MQKILIRPGLKWDGKESQEINDCLLVESPLQIIVNGQDLSVTMQTPGDERFLVQGLLHAEGLSSASFDSFSLEEWEQGQVARIKLKDFTQQDGRRFGSHSSCGVCGKQNVQALFKGLEAVESNFNCEMPMVEKAFAQAAKKQTLFSLTGGSHAAGAFDEKGELICLFEDIGRHNAVDKVIGFLLENERLAEAKLLTVSGRVSFEIIQKCVRAQIPALASISAVSTLAMEWAEKMNLNLMAFCRDGRGTQYTKAKVEVD